MYFKSPFPSEALHYDDYYPFGMVMNGRSANIGAEENIKFTGKERDIETGLDYFGARYYDSKIGRWMSVDPMSKLRPGLSPYNYVQNNPLNRWDKTGMLDEGEEDDENLLSKILSIFGISTGNSNNQQKSPVPLAEEVVAANDIITSVKKTVSENVTSTVNAAKDKLTAENISEASSDVSTALTIPAAIPGPHSKILLFGAQVADGLGIAAESYIYIRDGNLSGGLILNSATQIMSFAGKKYIQSKTSKIGAGTESLINLYESNVNLMSRGIGLGVK